MRRLSSALLLCAVLGARAAHAYEWPNSLYAGSVLGSLRWGSSGLSFGVGLRASWTYLRAPLPTGADLEAQWLFDRWAVRLSPSIHVYPDKLITGNECQRTQQVRARGNNLGIERPGIALMAGPQVELGVRGVDWGGSVAAKLGFALADAHLRGAWLSAGGPELELGAGLRLPSIMGDVDLGVICQ